MNIRHVLHCTILYANEVGHPATQPLQRSVIGCRDKLKLCKKLTTWSCYLIAITCYQYSRNDFWLLALILGATGNDLRKQKVEILTFVTVFDSQSLNNFTDTLCFVDQEQEEVVDEEREDAAPEPKKAKVSLPTATTTQATENEIEAIKEKARLLVNQHSPSEALILLSLDELAKTALAAKVDDADIFEELYKQVSRNQGKINLVTVVLRVMGVEHQMQQEKPLLNREKSRRRLRNHQKGKSQHPSLFTVCTHLFQQCH